MSDSLKVKASKGILWSSIERFSAQIIQFVIMIVMARILVPEDFGLIGMLTIFTAVSQSLIDSGFSQAIIRKQDRTEIDCSTVFYFNIVVSFILYIILFISAPLVAEFYNQPKLTDIMRVVCLGIIINSFSVVQRALFTINVDFRTQAKASIFAASISGIIGITVAYVGFGVWALVIQQLVNYAVNTIVLWFYSRWHPLKHFSWKSFNEMFSFGSKLLLSGLINTVYGNIYLIVIGKMFSSSSLGNYTNAHNFSVFPSSNISDILRKVTYPILCGIQDETERLQHVYRNFLKLSAFVVFPLMVGLSSIAKPFIAVVLGNRWELCGKLLQIICFSMMWYPIHAINLNLLQVKGRSDLFLRLEIIKKILGAIVLVVTVPLGLIAMCYGQIVSSIVALVINTYYTGKLINVGFIRQMCDLAPTILLCLIMFSVVILVNSFIELAIIKIITGATIGFMLYIFISYLFKFRELQIVMSLIKKK